VTLLPSPAHAARVVAPSDVLQPGSVAAAAFLAHLRGGLDASAGPFSSELDSHETLVGVEMEIWGPSGLSFALQQPFGIDASTSIDGRTTESADAGVGDLSVGASWLPSLGPGLRIGPGVALSLETGSDDWTDDRTELDLGGVVALSISTPVEVFVVPRYAVTFEDDAGQNDGDDLFFRLGVNIRLPRVSIVPELVFGRHFDDETGEGGLTQVGGNAAIAFEVVEGVTPAFGLAAAYIPSQEFRSIGDVSGWVAGLSFGILFAGDLF